MKTTTPLGHKALTAGAKDEVEISIFGAFDTGSGPAFGTGSSPAMIFDSIDTVTVAGLQGAVAS